MTSLTPTQERARRRAQFEAKNPVAVEIKQSRCNGLRHLLDKMLDFLFQSNECFEQMQDRMNHVDDAAAISIHFRSIRELKDAYQGRTIMRARVLDTRDLVRGMTHSPSDARRRAYADLMAYCMSRRKMPLFRLHIPLFLFCRDGFLYGGDGQGPQIPEMFAPLRLDLGDTRFCGSALAFLPPPPRRRVDASGPHKRRAI